MIVSRSEAWTGRLLLILLMLITIVPFVTYRYTGLGKLVPYIGVGPRISLLEGVIIPWGEPQGYLRKVVLPASLPFVMVGLRMEDLRDESWLLGTGGACPLSRLEQGVVGSLKRLQIILFAADQIR